MNGIVLRRYWLWPAMMVVGVVVLVLAPGGFAETSRAFVHGLCAQTVSHTFAIGGRLLPFDARMTGIYAGAGCSLAYLAARGRLLCDRLPSLPHLLAIAAGFGAMALDGTNSLLTDLGVWHPWHTTNLTRLVTGYAAGVAIAVTIVWLLSGTVYQISQPTAAVRTWVDLGVCVVGLPLLWITLEWGPTAAYVPLSLFLIGSAWSVVSLLLLVAMLLLTRRDERIVSPGQLHIPVALGMAVALVVMLALAVGRMQLERQFGIPSPL